MHDRQALAEQLLAYLNTVPDRPDYLAIEPEKLEDFDPYQMVGEWTALRQEIKQQSKLLQNSHTALQQALDLERSRNEELQNQLQNQLQDQLQTPPESTTKPEEDSGLLRDLLPVMDALDQAIAHSQSQITDRTKLQNQVSPRIHHRTRNHLWNKICSFFQPSRPSTDSTELSSAMLNKSLIDALSGNQEGIEMIRRSLLDLLQKRQITPILSLGQGFDSKCMYAIAQQTSDDHPTNTVLQEVVRGYRRDDRILREAQVIVSTRAKGL